MDVAELSLLASGGRLCPGQLKTLGVFVYAKKFELLVGAILERDGVCAGSCGRVEHLSFLRQRDVLVDQFGKTFAPIGRDKEVL